MTDAIIETPTQKRIREANEDFERMTPDERRVAIAKDAKQQILAYKYLARCGIYCEMAIPGLINYSKEARERELFEVIDDAPTHGCVVCARGALFLSACSQFNNFKVDDITWWTPTNVDNPDSTEIGIRESTLVPVEARFFTPLQIGKIEAMFEVSGFCRSRAILDTQTLTACYKYGKSLDSPTKRLIEICDNFIRNEGDFVVPAEFLE